MYKLLETGTNMIAVLYTGVIHDLAAASSLSLARSDRRERSSETESINGPPYGGDSGVPVKVRKNKS